MQSVNRLGVFALVLLLGACAALRREHKETPAEVVPAALVDTRYDFGGFLDAGNWYRGNLHLHSTISDGKLPPAETVEFYRKLGYDFTALTDHIGGFRDKETKQFRPLVYPLAELNKPGFLVIPGIEYDTVRDGETIHFVVVGPGYDARLEDGEDLSHAVGKWYDKGAFAFIAHPHWSLDSTVVPESIAGLKAMEVFNYATWLGEGLRGYSTLHWDRMLRQGKPVLGVANDDSHRPEEHAGGGWVMVKADALTADAIVTALRGGKFYASAGPVFENVFLDTDGNIHVRCSPVKAVRALSVVGKVTQEKAAPGKTLREAVIPWDWKKETKSPTPFVRVECEDAQGRMAWTQAVFRKEK
jgi:hypothetical protein